jgi:hypothetical protein
MIRSNKSRKEFKEIICEEIRRENGGIGEKIDMHEAPIMIEQRKVSKNILNFYFRLCCHSDYSKLHAIM